MRNHFCCRRGRRKKPLRVYAHESKCMPNITNYDGYNNIWLYHHRTTWVIYDGIYTRVRKCQTMLLMTLVFFFTKWLRTGWLRKKMYSIISRSATKVGTNKQTEKKKRHTQHTPNISYVLWRFLWLWLLLLVVDESIRIFILCVVHLFALFPVYDWRLNRFQSCRLCHAPITTITICAYVFFFVCSVCISVLLCFFLSISINLYTIWVYNNLFKLNNMYTKHQPTKEWKKRNKTHTQMLSQGREQSVENQKCTKMNIQLKYPMCVWRCIVSVFLARKKN